MRPEESGRWQSEVLDVIFEALSASREIREALVFKGARVLNLRLGTEQRQSRDIDSNLLLRFRNEHPEPDEQRRLLQTAISNAVRIHFENMKVVRFRLAGVEVTSPRGASHLFGWDAFKVVFRVEDSKKAGVMGLPRLELDVAAPEALTASSTSELQVGRSKVLAYTLERIAGEKLRAFLSTPLLTSWTRSNGPGYPPTPRPERTSGRHWTTSLPLPTLGATSASSPARSVIDSGRMS